jgi:hypothetical protein
MEVSPESIEISFFIDFGIISVGLLTDGSFLTKVSVKSVTSVGLPVDKIYSSATFVGYGQPTKVTGL